MRIASSIASLAFAATTLGASATAFAQTAPANCPPGSWFCADAPPQQAPAVAPAPAAPASSANSPKAALPALPPNETATSPANPPAVVIQPAPPVVVYESAPPPVVLVKPRPVPPPYVYDPRTAPFRPEFGLNLHLGAASVGRDGSGMGIAGIGFRFRPARAFALEADFDAAGGHDYNRDSRSEGAFSLNGILFFNPRSVAQLYMIGGVVWSGADVRTSPYYKTHYSYFGGQLGVGLEFRLSRVVALNTDVRGLLRQRTDAGNNDFEFVRGNTGTNTSGAGIFNVGVTFYF